MNLVKSIAAFMYTELANTVVTVTLFGCMNASKTAQKLIDKLLSGLRHVAAAFQDDIICFSSSFDEHLIVLTKVFTRLREAKLTAN